MSSILDALEKLERKEAARREGGAPPAHAPGRAWIVAAVASAFVAGGGIAFWLGRGTMPAPPANVPGQVAPAERLAAVPAPVVVAPAAPSPPPTPAAVPADAAARVPVAEPPAPAALPTPAPPPPAPAALPTPAPPPPVMAAAPTPAAPAHPAPMPAPAHATTPTAAPPAAPPAPSVAPPRVTAQPPEPPALTRAPAGAPRVRISFLVYSAAAERRRVALTIDDGPMVTLHEGESAGGLKVERILTDRVQLHYGGQAFTLRARD